VVTKPTVDRAGALVERIEQLDQQEKRREAVALGLVDALLERDGQTLAGAVDALRAARAGADGELVGWLDAAISVAHWGLERVPSQAAVVRGTQAHDFLSALAGSAQLGSADLRDRLDTDETQVSRTGRQLLERGFVMRRKLGRHVFWQLTPRGRSALAAAPASERAPSSEFWREALRRGFERAYGDEPGEPREVDPTRERIIESTLELHMQQGVQATTWTDIADKTGVPVEKVEELFPTLDDLVRSCGGHFFETLQLPPADRAKEVFAGVTPPRERVRRLVGTFFDVYERGAEGIRLARRERHEVAALEESMEALDETFDALVAEALHPDPSSIAPLRTLTDVELWSALRQQGATADEAVTQASAAVERWLESHPAG
jgi:AcrR family transcriptional regulator